MLQSHFLKHAQNKHKSSTHVKEKQEMCKLLLLMDEQNLIKFAPFFSGCQYA